MFFGPPKASPGDPDSSKVNPAALKGQQLMDVGLPSEWRFRRWTLEMGMNDDGTGNNDNGDLINLSNHQNLATVLKATFPYSENLRIPCFHRTPDLGFGMLL